MSRRSETTKTQSRQTGMATATERPNAKDVVGQLVLAAKQAFEAGESSLLAQVTTSVSQFVAESELVESGVHEATLGAMREHPHVVPIQALGLMVISMGDQNELPLVLKAMNLHPSSPTVQRLGCQTLDRIACNSTKKDAKQVKHSKVFHGHGIDTS